MNSRKKRRILLQKKVTINDIIKGYILDLSNGGMYIHTQAEFTPGIKLDLGFVIDNKQVTVKAAVKHIHPGIGIGVKFLDLSQEASFSIRKFLESQPDIITEDAQVKKILLVDDNAQSRSIYRNRLLGEGFDTVEASNGYDALKKLQETKFDLLILDLWMEGIDGFKILQLMKINPTLKDIPVIVLSARSTSADLEKAVALGARDYLTKMTTTPLKLADRVKKILGN